MLDVKYLCNLLLCAMIFMKYVYMKTDTVCIEKSCKTNGNGAKNDVGQSET